MTPAAIDGKLRLMQVDNAGLLGMETLSAPDVEKEGE